MKQRYDDLSHALCLRAAYSFLDGKWRRRDVMSFVEEFCGVAREELWKDELNGACLARNEAAENAACFLEDMISVILLGREPEWIDPVAVRDRADGMTGKVRQIACLCIPHQLLGHLAKVGLEPLLQARILPQQHASIPGHGQTALKDQTRRYLRRGGLDIRCAQKVDAVHAYASLGYNVIVDILEREIPSARWLIALVRYLGTLAPGGHLIIGGYLDAWLFNLAVSYALRHVLALGKVRRGKFFRHVARIVSYMDDLAFMARTASGLCRAVKELARWSEASLRMRWRTTTALIRLLTVAQERAAKRHRRPAKRGCPNIDLGGFQIHRSYVTMRPRVFKRVRRCFLRAWRRLQETGTIPRHTAATIIARFGAVKQTCSAHFREKYHVDTVMETAKRITGNWNSYKNRIRKRWLKHALCNRIDQRAAACAA